MAFVLALLLACGRADGGVRVDSAGAPTTPAPATGRPTTEPPTTPDAPTPTGPTGDTAVTADSAPTVDTGPCSDWNDCWCPDDTCGSVLDYYPWCDVDGDGCFCPSIGDSPRACDSGASDSADSGA